MELWTGVLSWWKCHWPDLKSSLKDSIRFCGIFPILKQNFIAYRSSKMSWRPDCIFEIPQLWQSGFSRVYSNCCFSCSFESEIIKISQSSHKMCSNNIQKFQESTTILNACTKSQETYWMHHVFKKKILLEIYDSFKDFKFLFNLYQKTFSISKKKFWTRDVTIFGKRTQ